MEQPQPGPTHHGSSNRIKQHIPGELRYPAYAEGHDHLRSDQMDWRNHFVRMQQKLKTLQAENSDLKTSISKLTEERDKAKKQLEQSSYMYAQRGQMQAYAQQIQYEKEQLDQQVRMQRVELSRRAEELERMRTEVEDVVIDRDELKYKLNEVTRDNQRLLEKMSMVSNYDLSHQKLDQVIEQRDQLRSLLADVKKENQKLKEQFQRGNEVGIDQLVKERLAAAEHRNKELEKECACLRAHSRDSSPTKRTGSRESLGRHSSDENVGSLFRGRRNRGYWGSDEGRHIHPIKRDHSNSISELSRPAAIHSPLEQSSQLSFAMKKKLSASAGNLWESGRAAEGGNGENSSFTHAQMQLSKTMKEKEELSANLAEMRTNMTAMEEKVKAAEDVKEELEKVKFEASMAKEKIELLEKQEGMVMKQSTESYTQSVQLQTQLLELKTEKALLEKQRDIASRERDRVVTDAMSLKKKLETIKQQRQKDAKELATMRKQRDKATVEHSDTVKHFKMEKSYYDDMEKYCRELLNTVWPMFGETPPCADKKKLNVPKEEIRFKMEMLRTMHSSHRAILQKLFGQETVGSVSSADVEEKVELMLQERDSLLQEVEELQRSVSKIHEDRIFDLKQNMETLHMDNDELQRKNQMLGARVSKLETEREKLRTECERLDRQCEDMNITLSSPGQISKIWKRSLAQQWQQSWEQKHLQVPLGGDGLAGFSVVGGQDQPQLPNPGAFVVTSVMKGGPAEGILRIGDVLESINGVELMDASHRDAVMAVKESRGLLDIILHRRKKAHALQVGIAGAINSLGKASNKRTQQHEFSLFCQKTDVGFQYDWETSYTVTDITNLGPADKILKAGDRIIKVNKTLVTKEKPSAVKKLMKPQKGVLHLVVEREEEEDKDTGYLTSAPPPPSVTEILTPSTGTSRGSDHSSSFLHGRVHGTGSSMEDLTQNSSGGERSAASSGYKKRRSSSVSYHSATQDSTTSQEPVKMVATHPVRKDGRGYIMDATRPTSDGIVYGFQDRPRDYEDYTASDMGSTGYSEGASESFLSEPCSYPDLESSQTSIELTFHSISQVSHNRLTVQSTMSTQPDGKELSSQGDESYFARDDGKRQTALKARASSNGATNSNYNTNNSQLPEQGSRMRLKQSSSSSVRKGWRSGSLSQLSASDYEELSLVTSSKKRSRSKSLLAIRGRSRSNLSLTPARSMTLVTEEPRRSISTTSVNSVHDLLADAVYIRANFSYVPRQPKELYIQPGDVFHIIEEAPPQRYRHSFWVSRLNKDGSDAAVGAIPNTARAQSWVDEQGECVDITIYEEVEAYTGVRPVLICGVLADHIAEVLAETYPKIFYLCPAEFLEGIARIQEARYNREQSEGKIIDYHRVGDSGYRVIMREAVTTRKAKGKHVLLAGGVVALHSLNTFAPPISILVKAGAEESIRTFGPSNLSHAEIHMMYTEAKSMEEQYKNEFTACLTLVYEDTLLEQITDIVATEKVNQTWVTINREPISP